MLIVGIAGGTGSGKTTVVNRIIDLLPKGEVVVLPQDAYYRDSSHLPLEQRQEINFDHPDSIEFELLVEHVKLLKEGKAVEQPIYSYLTCTRAKETITIKPRHVVIIEGILIFTCPELRNLLDIKVFVDADADDRLSRVIARDIVERGRSVNKVLDRYEKTVKPMHLQFIEPTKRYADIIVPQGGNNAVAISILASIIEKTLRNHNLV
ncbi:MAG: uridine kinase [Bacteroidales bacterium]|jgi:uridine kinase|nr:uridine kinase [Bacteroidales bacterium]HNT40733.1 uridine kinase [Tenuifilaceae bacterium]MBP8642795.1 uridine kinase [Bacteroidales bacterium]NLI87006.1 uridine kinase [Bacteroidales bacterium]HOA08857.1 uridine kinase [Tenuifilaceae bacterium]